MKNNNTKRHYSPKQGRLPEFISDSLEIDDPVLAFDEIMEEIGIEQYLKPEPMYRLGRPGYNRVNMLKMILFGFMDTGYASLRELHDRCKVNLRYMYLMDYEVPSYRAFGYFINEELADSIENIYYSTFLTSIFNSSALNAPMGGLIQEIIFFNLNSCFAWPTLL